MKSVQFEKWLWKINNSNVNFQTKDITIISTKEADVRLRDSGGSLPSIVFFCDPPVMVEAYDDIIMHLKHEYRVIVVELPGFGFSKTHSAETHYFSKTVTAIESALQQLALGQMILCGPCICGFVASELVRREILPVKGLVLMQTPDINGMSQWQETMDPKGLVRTKFLGPLLVWLNQKKLIPFWFRYSTAKSFNEKDIAKQTLKQLHQGGAYPLASMMRLWKAEDLNDSATSVPALIIWGLQDRSHKHTNIKASLCHAPDGKIIELEECGHFSELEAPLVFLGKTRPFFKDCFSS